MAALRKENGEVRSPLMAGSLDSAASAVHCVSGRSTAHAGLPTRSANLNFPCGVLIPLGPATSENQSTSPTQPVYVAFARKLCKPSARRLPLGDKFMPQPLI